MRPSGTIVYPLAVTNLGPDPAENMVIKDPTNPGLVRVVSVPSGCTVAVGTVTCHLGTLAGGAAVYSTTPSPNVANNQSCATTVARSPSTDVSVVKEGPATVPAGGTIEYSITVDQPRPAHRHRRGRSRPD